VVNPAHEKQVERIILEEYPSHLLGAIPIVLSHRVAGRKGEYARTMSAILDAYLHDQMYHGLASLERVLRRHGYRRPMLVVHNSGGMAQMSSTHSLQTVHSGPVAGLEATQSLSVQFNEPNLIATDMGGTSFDIGLVTGDGVKFYDFNPVIDRWLVSTPMSYLHTLGAGGGSIARFDRLWNAVEVGPESAGSDPGPACYGRGGRFPTTTDANLILFTEIALMTAFLVMNAADLTLQGRGEGHYIAAGAFPISSFIASATSLASLSSASLIGVERTCWWFHIIGILAFLNYLVVSKHLHILLAFPNVWYSSLKPKTEIVNMERITGEVKSMLDPGVQPPVPGARTVAGVEMQERFGAKDVFDLSWKQLMDGMTCTECGRCTSVCPANLTGKLLSPRKIMMDTRDRLEEVGKVIDAKGKWEEDGKSLHSRISEEELWACTTCNACTEACPVNIDPVGIIVDMRRYLVMEESKTRPALANMLTNVENNGAPWQMSQADRMKWTES